MLFRYSHSAGSKDFELFSTLRDFADRVRGLSARTSVIAFREIQLPIRGLVDEEFISRCLSGIPEGSEYLIRESLPRTELRTDLEECRGALVAVGFYPPWLEDNEDVISAIVPDSDGVARCGIY